MGFQRTLIAAAVLVAGWGATGLAGDLREPASGTVFPGTVVLSPGGELTGIGVGLREATIMKLNVYAIAAYVVKGTDLGDDPGARLLDIEAPKQFRLVFVRDIEGDKMRGACAEAIRRNYGVDTKPFAADLESFFTRLPVKFHSGDRLNLTYVPGVGVWGEHNDDRTEPIDNPALMRALWGIWVGEHPVSDDLKQSLLGAAD